MIRRTALSVLLLFLLAGCGTVQRDPEETPDAGFRPAFAVLSVSPADGATLASNEVVVELRFNRKLDSSSLSNGENVRIEEVVAEGEPAPVVSTNLSVSEAADGSVVTLYPTGFLAWSRTYAVQVETSVRSADGESLEAPFTSTFLTPAQN